MTDLVILVPSRCREAELNRFIGSVKKNAVMDTFVSVWLSDDTIIDDKNLIFVINNFERRPRCGIANKWNRMAERVYFNLAARYLMIGNDDSVVQTKGFDKKLIEAAEKIGKYSMVYPNDGFHPGSIATFPMLSAPLYNALGYIFSNAFNHNCPDIYLQDLCTALGICKWVPEVVIEHMHVCNKKANMDEVYKIGTDPELYAKDRETYDILKKNKFPQELERLKKEINRG